MVLDHEDNKTLTYEIAESSLKSEMIDKARKEMIAL